MVSLASGAVGPDIGSRLNAALAMACLFASNMIIDRQKTTVPAVQWLRPAQFVG